jgi:DNA-binding NarL/FixJ family response regulator
VPVNNQLTAREIQVLNGIADGLTNREIAVKINLAVATVGDYKKRLFNKLYAYNSAHAVAEGFRKGWLK